MKKIFTILLLTFVFFMSACSLQKNTDTSNLNSKVNNHTNSTASSNTSVSSSSNDLNGFFGNSIYGTPYYMSDVYDSFKNNPIDIAYKNEKLPNTPNDGGIMALKYLNIWKNEVDFSVNNLAKKLNPKDAQRLKNDQKAWENSIPETISFDNAILNGDYNIDMGSRKAYTFLYAEIYFWRNRDIQLKNLTYYLETESSKSVSENQWTWNKFYYPQSNTSSK